MNNERINIYHLNPEYYTPLIDLDKKLRNSALNSGELLLIKIRASQINGCAYCIQSHIREAIEKGERQYRIHGLMAWQESPYYTEEERLILKMTEEITDILKDGLTSSTYSKALKQFGEEKLSDIIMAIVAINAWNRIGISTQLAPVKSQD